MTNRINPNYLKTETVIDKPLAEKISQAYNAETLTAAVMVSGMDRNTGKAFLFNLVFSENDPEFVQMLNDYAARKAGLQLVNDWHTVTDLAPADFMPVIARDADGRDFQVYRYGSKWFANHVKEELFHDFKTYKIATE